MKSQLKLFFALAILVSAAGCNKDGGGGSAPVAPNPNLNTTAALCGPAAVGGNIPGTPGYNPNLPTTTANNIPGTAGYNPACGQAVNPGFNGMPNAQTNDIGILQAGGQPIIRSRQFHLARGYGVENTDDSCTVDKAGAHVGRPVRRILAPGMDDLTLNFDASGALMISMRTGVGEVRSSGPVYYQVPDGQNIIFPNGFILVGQPSATYVSMETQLGFGMLKATDKQMKDDFDISPNNNPFGTGGALASPSFVGTTGYNPNFLLTGAGANGQVAANGVPGNPVVPLGGTSLIGNGVNELSMNFPAGTMGKIVTYPINPQHVLEIYLDVASYEGTSVVAISTPSGQTTCRATSQGQLLRLETR